MSALDHVFIRAYSKDTQVRARVVDSQVKSRQDATAHVEQMNAVDTTARINAIAVNQRAPSESMVHERYVPKHQIASDENYATANWYRADPRSTFVPSPVAPSAVTPSTIVPRDKPGWPSSVRPTHDAPACHDSATDHEVAPTPANQSLDDFAGRSAWLHDAASLLVMPPSVFPISVFPISASADHAAPRPAIRDSIIAKEPAGASAPAEIVFGRIDQAHDSPVPASHIKSDWPSAATVKQPVDSPDEDEIHVLKLPAKGASRHVVDTRGADAESESEPAAGEDLNDQEFDAAWEVSQIVWPKICEQLYGDDQTSFVAICEKLRATADAGRNLIAVTSHRRGEGRTTLALCLARELADAGANILLIDADFQNPQIAAQLQLNLPGNWTDAARRQTSLAESAVRLDDVGLTLLTLGAAEPDGKLSLRDKRVAEAIRQTANHFDIVLVDAGPAIDGKPECVDAAIIVCDCRKTTQGHADRLTRQLNSVGVEVLGVAKNFDESLSAADVVTV